MTCQPTAPRTPGLLGRCALWLALGSVVVWFVLLSVCCPQPLGDEKYHFQVVLSLARGEPFPLDFLTVLPTYHFLAAGAVKLLGESLAAGRAAVALLAIATILVFYAAAWAHKADGAGAALLLFAWNPLLFPFSALVYSEMPTVLMVALALLFRLRRWTIPCAGALLAACVIRQTSVVWLLFFAGWHAQEVWRARAGRPAPVTLSRMARQLWPYVVAVVLFSVFLVLNRGVLVSSDESNRVRVNVAQFYVFGLTVAVLWAPLWVGELRRGWGRRLRPALAHGWVCALVLVAIGLLEMLFDNPHPWNVDPNFLRNWPLMWMHDSLALRLAVAAGLVLLAPLVVGFVRAQPNRGTLILLWCFWVLFITPHWLVDPRYYIIPVMLVNFLTDYPPIEARRLVWWQLALTVALAAYIAGFSRML